MVKQKKVLKVFFVALCVCALVAPCALRARAETITRYYNLGTPELYQSHSSAISGDTLSYSLVTYWPSSSSYTLTGLNELDGFGAYVRSNGDRLYNLPAGSSVTEIPYSRASFFSQRWFVNQSSDITENDFFNPTQYVFLSEYTTLRNRGSGWSVALPHLIYDSIPVPIDSENRFFKMSYTIDFFNNESAEGYVSSGVSDLVNSAVLPKMLFHNGGTGQVFVLPSSVLKTQTGNYSWNFTAYWDLSGEDIAELTGNDFVYMRPIVTYPIFIRSQTTPTSQAVFAWASFPQSYSILSDDQYEEDVDEMLDAMKDIRLSLDQQTAIITGKMQDLLDEEEQATHNNLENATDEGLSVAENVLDLSSVSSAFENLVTAFMYQGNEFTFKFPASGNIPYIGELWGEYEIPFRQYINVIPSPILSCVRFLGWLGLVFSFVHVVKKAIADLNGGGEE